jgi:hypothetical protein
MRIERGRNAGNRAVSLLVIAANWNRRVLELDRTDVIDPGTFMTLNNGVTDLAREGIDERQFRFGLRIQF